ncbi:MAG: hypothetical protein U1D41_10020 [Nitrosomonas sp.]|uniref:hypothetical protein n=1 Tax=Nitrosomonas sp. TaxID=42353 RepID=UPI002732BEFE|nr:hypothetical protein [Nitrosomonas sp.]MDP3279818.1 hypothetical protein [Nitrosomonas sp.]MDP3662045.1 hypothetical protein [Nitrosomonas sp.]MDZ4106474.1 hypothetical protein [Nitrosomonas sp.]
MDYYQLGLLSFVIYAVVELVFRGAILFYNSGKEYFPWRIFASYKYLKHIISPGLWASENCKEYIKETYSYNRIRKKQLSKFIQNSNCLNFSFSVALFVVTLYIPRNGDMFIDIFLAFVMWRYISRSYEIAIAFGSDVLSSDSKSSLDNHARMKLAMISYCEIFFYSAAFYSASSFNIHPFLASLYVGTLTNVSAVVCSTNIIILKASLYIQVFATLSLIFFAFAGYLGRVKSASIDQSKGPHTKQGARSRIQNILNS